MAVIAILLAGMLALGVTVSQNAQADSRPFEDRSQPLVRLYSAVEQNHAVSYPGFGIQWSSRGYVEEGVLGRVFGYPGHQVPGTRFVYTCYNDRGDRPDDFFESRDANCEGQDWSGERFSLFESPGDGRIPVYRCLIPGVGDHFLSNSSTCEGQVTEGLLGYAYTP